VSSAWPAPTRAAHQKFVETEGWVRLTGSTGRIGDHHRYQLLIDDDILRTRISHPPSAKHTYGPSRWRHILRDQLKVSEAEFWACVRDGILPDRSQPLTRPEQAIPVAVVNLLINQVGLDADTVRGMTKDEAIERLNRYWTEGA